MKSMFLHDLKVACRSLLKYKLQTVISVVGLAVGLSVFVVCNVKLHDELMWGRRLSHAENIYYLYADFSNRLGMEIRDKFPEIDKSTVFEHAGRDCVIKGKDGNEKWSNETFIYSDSSFIDFFDFELLQGNWKVVKNLPNAVILTESAALRMYGTTNVVGQIFINIGEWSGEKEYKVAGLITDFPRQTLLGNMHGLILNAIDKPFGGIRNDMLYRLQPDVNVEALNNKIALHVKEHPDLLSIPDVPKFEPHLESSDSSTRDMLSGKILFGIGLLVLLTAIFNYVMFMSGRILNRQKEYGVRQINGASSKSIFRMFTTEITLSIGLSVLLSMVFLELLTSVLTKDISSHIFFDEKQNWLSILGMYLFEYAVFVWGMMISICWLVLKRFRKQTTLQHIQGGGVRYKNRLSNLLLVLQITICILLSGGSYFLFAQQEFLMKGYRGKLSAEECKRTYIFTFGGHFGSFQDEFQNMVNSNPYIEVACLTEAWSLFHSNTNGSDSWKMEGINNESGDKSTYKLEKKFTDTNYPKLMHAKIEEGRFFRGDESDFVVVNREFIRHFKIDPLGKSISIERFGWKTYTIIGIIENVEVYPELKPCIYVPNLGKGKPIRFYVKFLLEAKPEVLESIKAKMQEQVYSFTELDIITVEKELVNFTGNIDSIFFLVSLFASICIIICLLGIYSSMMLAVEKRGREMAIRKINGARLIDIARIFVKHYFVLLGIAALIAFPALYLGVQTWLENYANKVLITPFPFIAIFVLLFAIILLTIGSQLIKIMRVNPVEKLKSE